MRSRRWNRRVPVAFLVAAVAACSEDVVAPQEQPAFDAPQEQPVFDAAALQANLEAFERVFASEGWASFRALGPAFAPRATASGAASVRSLEIPPDARGRGARRAALEVARRLLAPTEAAPGALADRVISENARGTTFVYDPERMEYVPDPDRAGAPANGVRFILYAVNPVTGQPIVELEIGWADLLDEGEGEAGIALRLEVVSEGEKFLDYSVRVQGDEGSGTIAIAGFIRNGVDRLDFEIQAAGTSGEGGRATFDLNVRLEIAARDFEVEASVSGVEAETGGSGEIELVVRYDGESVRIEIAGTENSLEAAFFINGELFATASGDPEGPEIRGADGQPLSPEEMQALAQILELADDLFNLFGGLMEPAGAIVGLGLAL